MAITRRQFALSTVTAAVVHSQPSEDPAHLSLAEASRRIRAGTVNPTQLTEACLERIRAYNPKRDKIYSEPRNGTTFYVLLPATPRQGNSGRSIPTRPFCCSAVSVTRGFRPVSRLRCGRFSAEPIYGRHTGPPRSVANNANGNTAEQAD